MKPPLLLLSFCAFLCFLFIGLPEARAQQSGLLLLEKPWQYVEFDYEYQNLRSSSNGGNTTSSSENRLEPSYFFGIPFAIYNPDIFVGYAHTLVKYEQDYFSSSSGQSQEESSTNIYYGLEGTFYRKKPLSVSFYANSEKTRIQQEFSPGYDDTITNYGALARYNSVFLPFSVKYDHNENQYTNQYGFQDYNDDLLSFQTTHSYRNFMKTDLYFQDRWIRNNAALLPSYSLNELSANFDNSIWWKLSPITPGYLTSSISYMNTTGEQSLTTAQITETLSQTLGRALQSGASYSYSVQQAPQQTTHSQAGNMWLTHQLFESLRTQLNLQGTSNEIGDGSQTQITGSGNLIYQKKLPRNSDLQIQVGDSYQWNDQQMANSVVTQLNESIKITDITLSYPLANHNVTAISQVFNSTETIKYQDPADYGTFVIGNITYITINPTGLIHTGDVLLVTYQYMVDTDLTFTANTVSASASVTLFSNLLSVFGQFSDTQQHLISGNDTFAKLGNYKTASLGAQANVTNNTFGAKYIYTYNPGITEDSFNGYWWYSAVFGKNQLRLSLTDTYNSWTDNVTQAKNHNNALNAYVTANRQFTRSAQGSLAAGYIRTNGSTSENSAYFKAVLTYVLGKFQFWVNAQSLLNNYTNQSQTLNNTVSLQVRRNF